MNRSLSLLAAATLGLTACGTPQSDDASQLAALGPDLRFVSPVVEMAIPGAAALVSVSAGETFTVPCNTSGFRGRYRYGNAGDVAAAGHTNRSHTAGGASYAFAQAGLGIGIARSAWASFGAVPAPNTPTVVAIRLDSTLAIAESAEGNNAWSAKVVRKCP